MRVLGVDPSLTATCLALIDLDTHAVVDTWTLTSKGHRDDTIRQRLNRIQDLADAITMVDDVTLVVIEYPTLSQGRQGGHLDRHGLWWLIADRLNTRTPDGGRLVAVPASTRARYATGKGNAGKDTVLLEVARRYPTVPVANNNEADALVLAAMGFHHLTGSPLVDLPAAHRAALAAVTWPASTGRAA